MVISCSTACFGVFSCTFEDSTSSPKQNIQLFIQYFNGSHQYLVRAMASVGELRKAVANQRAVSPLSITMIFHGKILSDDSETLAAAGLIAGSTVHCDFHTLRGGVGSKFILSDDLREKLSKTPSGRHQRFSITRPGLSEIIPKLLLIANGRGFTGDDITSHDLAALFQGKSWKNGKWTEEKDKKLQFHPMDKFQEHYSGKMPTRMISYTWASFGLIKVLNRFLNECEKLFSQIENSEATYWCDILFNDQNHPDMKLYLGIADGLYSAAERHFAFLFGGMMARARCIAEIITRFLAALKVMGLWKECQDNTDAVIKGGELLSKGDPAFTTFVTVEGLTDLVKDVLEDGKGRYGSVDRFGTLQAFDDNDLKDIKEMALRMAANPEAFNFLMTVIRSAVLSRHADQHPVRSAHPSIASLLTAAPTPSAHPGPGRAPARAPPAPHTRPPLTQRCLQPPPSVARSDWSHAWERERGGGHESGALFVWRALERERRERGRMRRRVTN